jgi:hypothetical protein
MAVRGPPRQPSMAEGRGWMSASTTGGHAVMYTKGNRDGLRKVSWCPFDAEQKSVQWTTSTTSAELGSSPISKTLALLVKRTSWLIWTIFCYIANIVLG